VDNYQGEENHIIILSLVRNNAKNNIGFLKSANRVCVALSRAQHGLFIFGNAPVLRGAAYKEGEEKEHIWLKVIKVLNSKNCIVNKIQLKCVNH